MPPKAKYKQLIGLFKDCRKKQIMLFIICTISIIVETLLVYQIQDLIDSVVEGKSRSEILPILFRIIMTGIITFVISVVQARSWHFFRHELINKMRIRMYKSMLNKRISYFDSTTTGDITSAIINDGSIIAEHAGISVLMLLLNLVQIFTISGILIYLHIELGIIVIILGILYLLLINILNKEMRKTYREEREEFADLNQCVIEDINAINDITVLNKKTFFIQKFRERVLDKYFAKVKKVISVEVKLFSINTIMKIILPVMVIALGVNYSFNRQITVGTLVIFYTFIGSLIEPLNNLTDFNQGKNMALGTAERIYDFLFDEVKDDHNFEHIDKVDKININIGNFAYDDKNVLNNINYTLFPGDKVLIKGESGKGKTTLLKLICKLYDLKDGDILINNHSISVVSNESLYQNIKILFQQPFVFEGTILENLTLGDRFDENHIMEVLDIVCLGDFVREKGLNYQLYEQGKNLSGGQKQRLCLARILLRDPKILLLDEITSALDSETEEKLLQGLDQYIVRNNIIMIAVSHSNAFENICNIKIQLS